MLTPDQVTAVSRSLIGHMLTDPSVRTKMDIDPNGSGADAALASVINSATSFTPPVSAADVPAILAAVRTLGSATGALEALSDHQNSIFFKSS